MSNPSPRTLTDRDFLSCVFPAAFIGGVWGYLFRWFTPDESLWFWLTLLTQTGVTLIVFMLFMYRRVAKRSRTAMMPRSITPSMIDSDDDLQRHVMARSWNTGKPAMGWYDENGKMHFREQEMPRVPITVTDKHGNITDGTAEAYMTMVTVDGHPRLSAQLRDVRDLDGNVLPIPPGGTLNGEIHGG